MKITGTVKRQRKKKKLIETDRGEIRKVSFSFVFFRFTEKSVYSKELCGNPL